MSAVAYVERASRWARDLEQEAASSAGLDRVEDARPIVARMTGVPTGTLRNLVQNRVKNVSAYAYDKLNQAAARLLERKLARLQHELDLTRQQGLRPDAPDVLDILADIETAKAALGLTGVPASPEGGVE